MRKVSDLELAAKLEDKFLRYKSGELSSLSIVILVNEHLNQFINALTRGTPRNSSLERAALECDKLSEHEGNEYLKANPHNTFSSSVAVDMARFLATKIRNLKGDEPMDRANKIVVRGIPSDACPFCGEDDFDGPSLAGHIANDCPPADACRSEFETTADRPQSKFPCSQPNCGGWFVLTGGKTRCNDCGVVLTNGPIGTINTRSPCILPDKVSAGLLGATVPAPFTQSQIADARLGEIERRILKIEEWIQP